MDCALCAMKGAHGNTLLWQDADFHLVRVHDPLHPCYYRIIANAHIVEMSDLDDTRRQRLWMLLHRLEQAVRARLAPQKINVASLGNVTPHLHWHLIGRWRDDAHFPDPVWSPLREEVRAAPAGQQQARRQAVEDLRRRVVQVDAALLRDMGLEPADGLS